MCSCGWQSEGNCNQYYEKILKYDKFIINMAVYKKTLNGILVKIHNVDHLPPHCHVFYKNYDMKVDLLALKILNPPPNKTPQKLSKALKQEQNEMLKAWDKVKVIPSGSSPGTW